MSRAETITWLSLDEWATIIGVNPLHFNGLSSNTLFPGTTCGSPWQQFAWQNAQQISREDLAITIRDAERAIANFVGYNLIPDWIVDERHRFTRPAGPTLYNVTGLNVRGQKLSVQAKKGYAISGGLKAKTVIEAGATVVRTDSNGDGYDDLVTITVTTSLADTNEIRVFYPGENGDDDWEIRPIEVVLQGVGATITFKSWQIVNPDLQDTVTFKQDGDGIDAEAAASYLTTVDVYRVFNDPQQQIQFLSEPVGNVASPISFGVCSCGDETCVTCEFATQFGCLMVREERKSIFAYGPGTWNAANGNFDSAALAICRSADRGRLWYYAGWTDDSLARPRVTMDKYWQYAVAYYAAALYALRRATQEGRQIGQ